MSKYLEVSKSPTPRRRSFRTIFYVLTILLATIFILRHANFPTTQPLATVEDFSFGPPNITRKYPNPQQDRKGFISTPDLPIWDPILRVGHKSPSGLIFATCLSDDNSTLYFNGQQFFPPRDANVPPRLKAPQVEIDYDGQLRRNLVKTAVLFDMDYKWAVRLIKADELASEYQIKSVEIDGIMYHDGLYEMTLDILGASVQYGYNTLTRSYNQQFIRLQIQVKTYFKWGGREPEDAHLHLTIVRSTRELRDARRYTFPYVPNMRSACRFWSWRCAELDSKPWYSIVMKNEFDEWGRIGCGRREWFIRLHQLQNALGGPEGVRVLLIVAGLMFSWYIRRVFINIDMFYFNIIRGIWRIFGRPIHNWKEEKRQELEFKRLDEEGEDLDESAFQEFVSIREVRKEA
jgi:hypothetical protein